MQGDEESPLGPQTVLKRIIVVFILNRDRNTWSEIRMVKIIEINRHINPKDCSGIAENCEKVVLKMQGKIGTSCVVPFEREQEQSGPTWKDSDFV